MRLYKLTDANDQSYGNTQWGEGVMHTAPGTGELCTSGWLHAYTDPFLAVLLNPIHGKFPNPHLWKAEGKVGKTDHGLKVGCTTLTTVRQIPLPVVTTEQRVTFALRCALSVYHDATFVDWAAKWISGSDRSQAAWAAAAWAEELGEAAAASAAASAARAAAETGALDLIVIAHECCGQ